MRARLAWHWRRLWGVPAVVYWLQPPVGFYASVVDPRPPWRAPRTAVRNGQ